MGEVLYRMANGKRPMRLTLHPITARDQVSTVVLSQKLLLLLLYCIAYCNVWEAAGEIQGFIDCPSVMQAETKIGRCGLKSASGKTGAPWHKAGIGAEDLSISDSAYGSPLLNTRQLMAKAWTCEDCYVAKA